MELKHLQPSMQVFIKPNALNLQLFYKLSFKSPVSVTNVFISLVYNNYPVVKITHSKD